jgi:hypothetical protein
MARRRFLASLGLGALWVSTSGGDARRGDHELLYAGCRAAPDGSFLAGVFDAAGALRFEIPLPARGHGIAFAPRGSDAVVLARRPGTFGIAFDRRDGRVAARFEARPGRHFYGHGVFTHDGRHLLTTENDYERERGVIGIRDAQSGYRQEGEIPSHGIGPHEVRLSRDGGALVVANGGILTRPESGRAKLNLDAIRSTLTVIALPSGAKLEEHSLGEPFRQISIRHLDLSTRGAIAFAMQYEGPNEARVPLVGILDRAGLRLLEAPRPIDRLMRHYTASVAFDRSGETLAVSSPRGNIATFWSVADGAFLTAYPMADVAGVAPASEKGAFMLTGKGGRVVRYALAAEDPAMRVIGNGDWDNHLSVTRS